MSLSEVMLAGLIMASCVGPVLYFFPAARRQAGHDEEYLVAWGRARTAAVRAAALGATEGFPAEVRTRQLDGVEVRVGPVPGSPGLFRVTATASAGGDSLPEFRVVEDRLVADPAWSTSGGVK